MARQAAQPPSPLSYLVGPGPSSKRSSSSLRIGVSNTGESVQALRLRISLLSCAAGEPPLAEVELGIVLPRRAGRELQASIDWQARQVALEQRMVPFRRDGSADVEQVHIVRAELFDGRRGAPHVLEVGVGGRASQDPRGAATP